MYFFTSDEHYGHDRVFIVQQRGFDNIKDHDETLISNHNSIVSENDIVVHAGDFTLMKPREKVHGRYVRRLNGTHIFLKGSHDYWLKGWDTPQIWEKMIDKQFVVVCHYCMRTWARSHYNSWQLYGHSHGRLDPIGKQWDVGVDNNFLHPVPWTELVKIMASRDNNPNLIYKQKK